jgi:putative membrane protein
MNFLVRLLLSAVAVIITAYLLPGIHVDSFFSAFILAVVLAVLNVTLKPLMIIITIPLTFVTLGLFLLVINALVILAAEAFTPGFQVDGFWWALLFSLILSILNSILIGETKKQQ